MLCILCICIYIYVTCIYIIYVHIYIYVHFWDIYMIYVYGHRYVQCIYAYRYSLNPQIQTSPSASPSAFRHCRIIKNPRPP